MLSEWLDIEKCVEDFRTIKNNIEDFKRVKKFDKIKEWNKDGFWNDK